MKIDIKQGGKKFSVNFLIVPGKGDVHFSAMAKSSKDLDALQAAVEERGAGDDMIGVIIGKALYEGRFDVKEALEAVRC